jgi:hypothetical protein
LERANLQKLLDGERANTKELIDQENQKFTKVLVKNEAEFSKTLGAILSTHEQDEKEFAGVVQKETDLIQSQEEVSERLAGRLVPGNDPTPTNACSAQDQGSQVVTVLIDDNAFMQKGLPTTILEVGDTPVITVDRVPSAKDELALSVNFRDSRNQIAIQVNKDGMVNRTSGLILLRPDKSTFLIEDQFGKEFFRAVYVNPRTFRVSGNGIYCGRIFQIAFPTMHSSCLAFSAGPVVGERAPACPTEQ